MPLKLTKIAPKFNRYLLGALNLGVTARPLVSDLRTGLISTVIVTHLFLYFSEKLIKEQALRMSADGFRDAGYEYVVMDDCWLGNTRDSNGDLQPNATRFPSGMKSLGDYVILLDDIGVMFRFITAQASFIF